jgi:hypothetical protein
MKYIGTLVMLISLLLPWNGKAAGQQAGLDDCVAGPHSGVITADETWCLVDSPHIITGTVTVNPGITLTVEAGVTVKSDWWDALYVKGHLEAVGTLTQPIKFTSLDDSAPTYWQGLAIDGGTADFQYVTIAYGGHQGNPATPDQYIGAGLAVRNVLSGTVSLQNSQIIHTRGITPNGPHMTDWGLYVENSHVMLSRVLLKANGDVDSTDFPVYVSGADSQVEWENVSFENNLRNVVALGPDAFTAHDFTLLRQTGLEAYQLDTHLTIPSGVTLTIEPGVQVISRTGGPYGLSIQGYLDAQGTSTQPIIFTSTTDDGIAQWQGIQIAGGAADLNYVTLRCAGDIGLLISNVTAGEVRLLNSVIELNGYGFDEYGHIDYALAIENSHVHVAGTLFRNNNTSADTDQVLWVNGPLSQVTLEYNTFENNAGGLQIISGQVTMLGNIIRNQPGIMFNSSSPLSFNNNVIVDIPGDGLTALYTVTVTGEHNTFARNSGSALISYSNQPVVMTNTILSANGVGVTKYGSGHVTMNTTLWDQNTTNIIGTVTNNNPKTGPAAFDTDGYHITQDSAALAQGQASSLTLDIDRDPRPFPEGSAPDIGADEYWSPSLVNVAEQVVFDPILTAEINPETHLPQLVVQQKYLLRYGYGSPDQNAPDVDVAITDTLPTEMDFDYELHNPEMDFSQEGDLLNWQVADPVSNGQTGNVLLSSSDNPAPGTTLTNTANIQIGEQSYDLEATTEIPVFAPIITSIADGEYCYANAMVEVAGVSQAEMLINIYENGIAITDTTADSDGAFSVQYISLHYNESITITAQACDPAHPTQCSADSTPVHLVPAESFWDPQRSYWEGTPTDGPLAGQHLVYHFRDSGGIFATEDWVIPGVYGFWNTNLHLYVCDIINPTPVTVTADGEEYTPDDIQGNWFTFSTIATSHIVSFTRGLVTNPGVVLIDPDGYIFDVNEGFDPADPTQHSLEGVTVTCMVWMPEWGGWVPWPAYLYEDQQNPQVTGENGYFAFFTPPGLYYLKMEGKDGYQAWRSPVIEVINEIVHVNVPLTPITSGDFQITLTADGPSLPAINILPGQSVAWNADMSVEIPVEQLKEWTERPVLHVLSDLDPLADVLGFDSGMLTPGKSYYRQFTEVGVYTYTDGYGHVGTITVGSGQSIFLPFISK